MLKAIAAFGAIAALTFGACGEEDLGAAPDVRGLSLPSAEKQLDQAGYSADVQTDATFGVIIESNFTVCDQSSPQGKLVPIEVDNAGC